MSPSCDPATPQPTTPFPPVSPAFPLSPLCGQAEGGGGGGMPAFLIPGFLQPVSCQNQAGCVLLLRTSWLLVTLAWMVDVSRDAGASL